MKIENTRTSVSDLLTRREAAAFLRISPVTLARWSAGPTPVLPVARIGGRRMYRQRDLEAYVQQRLTPAGHSAAGSELHLR